MKKATFSLIAIFMLINIATYSQDVIVKNNNSEIKAKIVEVGSKEIKFRKWEQKENGPVFVITKKEIKKVVFEDGRELKFEPDKYAVDQESQILDKTRAIKFHFFSPLYNHLAFGYEQMIKVGTSFEGKLGVIGVGVSANDREVAGGFGKAGVKFLLGKSVVTDDMRYAHPLKGHFLKPELSYSFYTVRNEYAIPHLDSLNQYSDPYYNYTYEDRTVNVHSIAINLIYGNQFILGNMFTLDYYFGLGYGVVISNEKEVIPDNAERNFANGPENSYSHVHFGKNFPMTMTGGLTVGYLFK